MQLQSTLCLCGCGRLAQPGQQYIRSHKFKKEFRQKPPEEQLWKQVIKSDGPSDCWILPEASRDQFTAFGVHTDAKRLAWGEPIIKGLCVCHICDNPRCMRNDDIGTYTIPGDTSGKTFPRKGHLWLGTAADNSADMVAKGRSAVGERHSSRTHPERVPRGDRNGSRTHPENIKRGDEHYSRTHPEKLARGDRNGARTHPETHSPPPKQTKKGEECPQAVFTEDEIRAIRIAVADGASQTEVGRWFGKKQSHINNIVHRRQWAHVI